LEPTVIVVSGSRNGSVLTLSVRNPAGPGLASDGRVGTGLARLRERLTALYGSAARLDSGRTDNSDHEAILTVPVNHGPL
jgi:LytS/YehU family sensor histidine kinase